jgi:hypothetical protein
MTFSLVLPFRTPLLGSMHSVRDPRTGTHGEENGGKVLTWRTFVKVHLGPLVGFGVSMTK